MLSVKSGSTIGDRLLDPLCTGASMALSTAATELLAVLNTRVNFLSGDSTMKPGAALTLAMFTTEKESLSVVVSTICSAGDNTPLTLRRGFDTKTRAFNPLVPEVAVEVGAL